MKCSNCGLLVPEGQTCYCQWGQIPPRPAGYSPYAAPRLEASRGGTILTLGILSLVVCSILGPFAWSMGSTELRRIDAGQVDPSGRGTAQAGMICGIVSTVLIGLVLAFVIAAVAAQGSGTR